MISPHLIHQIYLFFLEQNDCTPPKCGELSEYTDSAHTEAGTTQNNFILPAPPVVHGFNKQIYSMYP